MSNLKYTPEKLDNAEFHRIREWWNTFNAFVQGAANAYTTPLSDSDRHELRREARKFANSVHGRISKPRKGSGIDRGAGWNPSGFSGVLDYSNKSRWDY